VSARRGFTLMEMLVALTLTGVVVLTAHRLFAGVTDGLDRLESARVALDREANVRLLLAAALGSAQAGPAQDVFVGEADRMAFTTWRGDRQGHSVRLRFRVQILNGRLVLEGVQAEPLPLLEGITGFGLDYLLELGAEQRFVREWRSEASAPAAVRFRIMRGSTTDTLLLRVGSRG